MPTAASSPSSISASIPDPVFRSGSGAASPISPIRKSCDLNYDQTDIDLSCQWRFPDYAAALAFFDPLVEKGRRCLDAPLPAEEMTPQSPGWLIMRRYRADHTAGEGETKVELSLVEYTREADNVLPAAVAYYVELNSEWSLD